MSVVSSPFMSSQVLFFIFASIFVSSCPHHYPLVLIPVLPTLLLSSCHHPLIFFYEPCPLIFIFVHLSSSLSSRSHPCLFNIDLQDCELMDGVIDLADDDCISLASDL